MQSESYVQNESRCNDTMKRIAHEISSQGVSFVAVPRTVTLSRFEGTGRDTSAYLHSVDTITNDRWSDVRYAVIRKGEIGIGPLQFQVPKLPGYSVAVLMLWKQAKQLYNVRVHGVSVEAAGHIANLRLPNCEIEVDIVGSRDDYVAEQVCVRYTNSPPMHSQCQAIHDAIFGPVVILSLPEAMIAETHANALRSKTVWEGGPKHGLDHGCDDWDDSYGIDVNIPVSAASKWVGVVVEASAVEWLSTRDVIIESCVGFNSYIIPCPNMHIAVQLTTRQSTSATVQTVEAVGDDIITTARGYGSDYLFAGSAVPDAQSIELAKCDVDGHTCEQIAQSKQDELGREWDEVDDEASASDVEDYLGNLDIDDVEGVRL